MPSNDLLTRRHVSAFHRYTYSRRHVSEGGVNVRALKRSAYSESRQYLKGWRERLNLQTTFIISGMSVSTFKRRTYSEARQYLQTTYLLRGTSGPSNDVLTRKHVSEGGVNVSAPKRLTYTESRDNLQTWR